MGVRPVFSLGSAVSSIAQECPDVVVLHQAPGSPGWGVSGVLIGESSDSTRSVLGPWACLWARPWHSRRGRDAGRHSRLARRPQRRAPRAGAERLPGPATARGGPCSAAVRPRPRRASGLVGPWPRAQARAASAVSEGASWGPLSAVQPRSSAHRLHFSRVLVLSDSGPATPGRCWPGRGGQEHGWAEVSARAGRTSVRAQAAWHPVSRASCVRMGGHCRPGGLDLLVSWGRRVASRCRVQPLGFGVTGGARRGPVWFGCRLQASPPWRCALSEHVVRCPCPFEGCGSLRL